MDWRLKVAIPLFLASCGFDLWPDGRLVNALGESFLALSAFFVGGWAFREAP